jgi:hypothetical protein
MKFASILCGVSFACAFAVSAQAGQLSSYPSFSTPPGSKAGFTTNAKVALEWHWSEGSIRSVGVKKVASGGKGILCVEPSVSLNIRGIYPMVTASDDLSNTTTPIAVVRNEADLCPNENFIEVDTYQLSGGKYVASKSVGFFLIVE